MEIWCGKILTIYMKWYNIIWNYSIVSYKYMFKSENKEVPTNLEKGFGHGEKQTSELAFNLFNQSTTHFETEGRCPHPQAKATGDSSSID